MRQSRRKLSHAWEGWAQCGSPEEEGLFTGPGAGEDRTTSQMHRRLQVKAVPVWAEVVTHDLIRESHSMVFTAWSIPKSLVPSGR